MFRFPEIPMQSSESSTKLIVRFPASIGPLGLGQEDAALMCHGNEYPGRDAFAALMSIDRDTVDAERSLSRGDYPPEIRDALRQGRVAIYYLINCQGMNVMYDDWCRNAESLITEREGVMHTFASRFAESGGAFRLAAARPWNRHVLDETSILLHTRQYPANHALASTPTPADVKIADLAKIQSFFDGGSRAAAALRDAAIIQAAAKKDVRISGADLAPAALAHTHRNIESLREKFLAAFGVATEKDMPTIARSFFA